MAQKKTVKKEEMPAAPVQAEVEAPVQESKVISEKTVEVAEIPDYAKKVLALYPDEPELYVTPRGGAFLKASGAPNGSRAVLFKNPYYKS